jgi:sialate O-acetylesterase
MTLALKNTGMAVTIDVGDPGNLHPANKYDVGMRLSLIALDNIYGRDDIFYSGPLFRNYKIEGKKVLISFDHTASGLAARGGGALRGFKICGGDRNFYDAKAEIKEDRIVVWNDSVADPVSVRYAWADNPVFNLINSAGLPASPFRTDDWPEITYGKK